MKQITAFLLVILSLSLNAQQQTDIVEKLNQLLTYEAGKIYMICQVQDTLNRNLDTTYIAIINDEWEDYSFKVGLGFSPNGQTTFKIKPTTVKAIKCKVSSYHKEYYSKNNDNLEVQSIAIVEVPARYVSFKPITIIENGKAIVTVPTQKIQAKRIKRNAGLKYVTKEEALEMDEKDIYILVGKTEIRELFHGHGSNPTLKIIELQKALNEKGYKCPTDGILGKSTKNAIIQFQKDNNLPEGRLDVDTLKTLGVE